MIVYVLRVESVSWLSDCSSKDFVRNPNIHWPPLYDLITSIYCYIPIIKSVLACGSLTFHKLGLSRKKILPKLWADSG